MDIYSPSKAIFHTDKIKSLQNKLPISPTLLQVDLEAYCNDNCLFCSYRKENSYNNSMLDLILPSDLKTKIDLTAYEPIGRPSKNSGLDESMSYKLPILMKEAGIPAIEITGGGEPTIWPHFDYLLDNLISNGIEIGLVTNGSNLTHSRISKMIRSGTWIRISMDSSNQETHKLIHRTSNNDFERRINNIKELVGQKKSTNSKLTVGISFIITPQNKDDLIHSALTYKKLGVDNIRFSWMYDKEGHAGLSAEEIDYLKTTLKNLKEIMDDENFKLLYSGDRIDSFSLPNTDFNTCYYQRFVWSIGADNLVYPCCIQKYNKQFAFGDIRKNTLKELVELMNEKMTNLDVRMCSPCWLRDRNKSIASAVEPPPHVNFV